MAASCSTLALVFGCTVLVVAGPAFAAGASEPALCPDSQFLPQLTIYDLVDPALPIVDRWQVFLEDEVPLSDTQLAALAGDDALVDELHTGMAARGTWVYVGMLTAASGAAVSSVGWSLFGQDRLSQSVTMPLAIGGLLVGLAGVLLVTESVQRPLEPYLAPTPRHRFSRDDARALVTRINSRLYREVCAGVRASQASVSADSSLQR